MAIPDSVERITSTAFLGCPGLTSITVAADNPQYSSQDGVLFDKDAQVLCMYPGGKKGAYSIPDSVTSIGENAFDSCAGLTSVTIPGSVTSIGYHEEFTVAFYGCTNLRAITVAEGNTAYFAQDDVLYKKGSPDTLFFVPQAITGSVTIPSSVTSIGAFYGRTGLTGVTIPDSVTSIGNYAFYGCTGLTSVTIGNGVTSIEVRTFADCTGLRNVTIGNGVKNIGPAAPFYGCTGLASITIGANVKFRNSGFENDFDTYYRDNGRKAGTYTYHSGEWSFQAR